MAYARQETVQYYVDTGTSTTKTLSDQVPTFINEIDDIIILNISIDGVKTVTQIDGVPVGSLTEWTVVRNNTTGGVGHCVVWRRATAQNETPPVITLSGGDSSSIQMFSMTGCPTGSTPIGNSATSTGTSSIATWSTISHSANSEILYLSAHDQVLAIITSWSGSSALGSVDGGQEGVFGAKEFKHSSGTSTSQTVSLAASIGWQSLTLEVLDDGNGNVPMYPLEKPVDHYPTTGLTVTSTDIFRDTLVTAGVDVAGTALNSALSFDANTDVNTTTNQITITGHGVSSGSGPIYKADANGGTLPTGITDGDYYYIYVVDSNTIAIQSAPSVPSSVQYYDTDNSTNTVNITAVGSGTCRFLHAPFSFTNLNGTSSLIRASSGYSLATNFDGPALEFSTARDMSSETLKIYFETGSTSSVSYITLMDSDGDFRTWVIGSSVNNLDSPKKRFIEPDNTDGVVYESGTFNSASVKYIYSCGKYSSATRPARSFGTDANGENQLMIYTHPTLVGGGGATGATWSDIYYELTRFSSDLGSLPLASQVSFRVPIAIGDGSIDTDFDDSARAVGFINSSDGVSDVSEYIVTKGLTFYNTATSAIDFRSELLSSSDQWDFQTDASSSSSAACIIRNTVIQRATVDVDASFDFRSCSFISCPPIVLDGSNVQGSGVVSTTASSSQAALVLTANATITDTEIDVTDTSAGYHIELGTAVTAFTLDDVTFTGTPGTNKLHVLRTTGTVTITVSGTTSLVAGDITSEGATVSLIGPTLPATVINIVNGSRLQVYNITTDTETYNGIPGTTYSDTYIEGTDYTAGDTVRVRVTYQIGTTAYSEYSTMTITNSSGWSIAANQELDAVFNDYGVDGSTVTEFTWDGTNLEVDINDADNTTVIQRIAAWYHYEITTEVGIRELYGAIVWDKLNEVLICQDCVDIKLDNVKTTPLLLTGGRLYREDGTTIIATTSNSIQADYEPVYVTAADPDDLANAVWNDKEVRPNGSKGQRLDGIPKQISRNADL